MIRNFAVCEALWVVMNHNTELTSSQKPAIMARPVQHISMKDRSDAVRNYVSFVDGMNGGKSAGKGGPAKVYSLKDIRWPVFSSASGINPAYPTTFQPLEVLLFIAYPQRFRFIQEGESLPEYVQAYRDWAVTCVFEESLKWGERMWEGAIERIQEADEEKQAARKLFVALGKVMSGILGALGGDCDKFTEVGGVPWLYYNPNNL